MKLQFSNNSMVAPENHEGSRLVQNGIFHFPTSPVSVVFSDIGVADELQNKETQWVLKNKLITQ